MIRLYRSLAMLLLVLLVACGGAEDRKSVYLEKGRALYEEGNFEKARLEFQNVLQIDPKDLPARFGLAETLEKLENWQGAAGQYLAILNEDPNHRGALLNMGRLYLLSNADDKAQENAEKILATNPEDTGALVLLGGVKAKAGDRAGAKEIAEKVLKIEPNHIEGASLLSSLVLVEGDVEGSVKLLEDAIAAHPDEVALKINLARVFARAGRVDDASKTFGEVIKQKPNELAYRRAYARFLIGLQRTDEAGAVLKQAIVDFPGDQTAKLAYIEFLSGTQGVDQAITELQTMIDAEPTERGYQFALGKIYEAANRPDDAAAVYEKILAGVSEGPDVLTAKTRLAVVKTRQNDLVGARKLVDEVLAENPRAADALTLRGTLLLNDGDAPAAIADLRSVLRDAPANMAAIRLLSRAHLTNKEPELARDVLIRGMEANPAASPIALDLANFYASRNELDQALSTLDGMIERNPGDVAALEGKFKILVYRKDFDGALKVAEQLKGAEPQGVKGYYFAGLVRQAQSDFEASIGEFQSALDRSPAAVQPLSQLIKSYLVLKRRDDAVTKLKEVIADQPNNYVAHNLLGEIYLAEKNLGEAESELKLALEQNPQWPIPYRNLATVYAATERRDEAVALMKQGIEATNGSPLLLTSLASFLEQSGDLDAAIAEYEGALKKQPDSPLAANNLAMLLIEYRDDKASWERARELVTPLRNSDQAAYLDTVGWTEYKLGDFEQAKLFLEKAVELAPTADIMHYHLGMAYYASGNAVGAREHLAQALEASSDFRGADEARTILAKLTGPAS